ncbi:hypothetical protein ACNPKB_19360, partial [Shewanella marisflavi]|uniref:hypothetical protein n=1 Tax=Shewanella marisflavi TaxID=260364 RepID=UPI003AAD3607
FAKQRRLPCQWERIIGSRIFYARAFFNKNELIFYTWNKPPLYTNYAQSYPQNRSLKIQQTTSLPIDDKA